VNFSPHPLLDRVNCSHFPAKPELLGSLWLPHWQLWALSQGVPGSGTLLAASSLAQPPAVPTPFSAFPEGRPWERRGFMLLSRVRSLGSTLLNCSFPLSLSHFSTSRSLARHQPLSSDASGRSIQPRSALQQHWGSPATPAAGDRPL